MKIIECKQGTDEWFQARVGVVTASELKNLMTPKLEPRKRDSDMVQSYLARKLAERWTGQPLPDLFRPTGEMEQGSIRESVARPWFENETQLDVQTVGFITTDDGRCGCSPDGLIGGDCGLEIKCPRIETHVKYLLDGGVPDEYLTQIHMSMYVTGRPSWYFCSYRPGFPGLIVGCPSDSEIQARIDGTVKMFLDMLDEGYRKLVKANGGNEPQRRRRVDWDHAKEGPVTDDVFGMLRKNSDIFSSLRG